jgi:hypothetical protein
MPPYSKLVADVPLSGGFREPEWQPELPFDVREYDYTTVLDLQLEIEHEDDHNRRR